MDPTLICFRIDEILAKKDWPIARLARESGLSYRTVHDVYHNKCSGTDLLTLAKLSSALGVPVGDLFKEKLKAKATTCQP